MYDIYIYIYMYVCMYTYTYIYIYIFVYGTVIQDLQAIEPPYIIAPWCSSQRPGPGLLPGHFGQGLKARLRVVGV